MKNKVLLVLSTLMLFTALVVVILGAYTRLAHAGLGCPDWPTCYGHLWVPDSVEEISKANQRFEDTPVETDKTWPEQIHRIFASSLGLYILVFFYFVSLREKAERGIKALNSVTILLGAVVVSTLTCAIVGDALEPVVVLVLLAYFLNIARLWRGKLATSLLYRLTAILAGLVILQGLFGMWTVTLKLWPQVVTGHLLGGFTTLSLIALLWSLLFFPGFSMKLNTRGIAKKLILPALLMVCVQITLGGWTTSNYAALACPDLPTCQSHWLPKADFAAGFNILQHVGPNYLGGQLDNHARVAIHLSHRLGAMFTLLLVGLFVIRGLHESKDRATRRFTAAIGTTLFVQLGLGVSNILLALPLAIAVAHNAVGAVLLALTFIAFCRKEIVAD